MSHCLFVDVGWFVHFPGIDHVCYASMCFSSLSIHWLVRMAFSVNQYNSLMFYMIVLFFDVFVPSFGFFFVLWYLGMVSTEISGKPPCLWHCRMSRILQIPDGFLFARALSILYILYQNMYLKYTWNDDSDARSVCVCVCFVVFVPVFACTKCLPKQSRAFEGINSALNVAMLSGQEQIWAGTSYLGALRDCLVGSTKSTLPRVAF